MRFSGQETVIGFYAPCRREANDGALDSLLPGEVCLRESLDGTCSPGCTGLATRSDVAAMPPTIVAHAPAGIRHLIVGMLHRRGPTGSDPGDDPTQLCDCLLELFIADVGSWTETQDVSTGVGKYRVLAQSSCHVNRVR